MPGLKRPGFGVGLGGCPALRSVPCGDPWCWSEVSGQSSAQGAAAMVLANTHQCCWPPCERVPREGSVLSLRLALVKKWPGVRGLLFAKLLCKIQQTPSSRVTFYTIGPYMSQSTHAGNAARSTADVCPVMNCSTSRCTFAGRPGRGPAGCPNPVLQSFNN